MSFCWKLQSELMTLTMTTMRSLPYVVHWRRMMMMTKVRRSMQTIALAITITTRRRENTASMISTVDCRIRVLCRRIWNSRFHQMLKYLRTLIRCFEWSKRKVISRHSQAIACTCTMQRRRHGQHHRRPTISFSYLPTPAQSATLCNTLTCRKVKHQKRIERLQMSMALVRCTRWNGFSRNSCGTKNRQSHCASCKYSNCWKY
mmetsp:Transcript_18679/g.53275  ORF Transcript_18679/g.53275 Transcript_18679/m.53275 type:complete len:203 (-) Transcript_18679:908-1516(-)